MGPWSRFTAVALLSLGIILALGSKGGVAGSRAHVYLFRGLADVFSTGIDTLAEELTRRGVYATSHSHTDWKSIAARVAVDYKAGKEGPIILIGHSLGADAVMEMADYLGDKAVPVALVVPFDGTQSFPVPGNVGRVLNLTQRDYAQMRPGPGFRGTLSNVDLSSDRSIDHLNIDKSPRLHGLVIAEVLAVAGGRPAAGTAAAKPPPIAAPSVPGTPAKSGDGPPTAPDVAKSGADNGASVPAQPAGHGASTNPVVPVTPRPQTPVGAPQSIDATQIPD
jgi:hypothetical protein